ncbi:hypothetical protein [Acrocarpospora catenulata]|uniref:hypothetical protein n=1 Tax=Acrocarpospora catenulata TaxID=2836182 RepID=UPI001BD93E37|nr:hypothetical protein [Acrocarpospora catenulata]
MLRNTLRLARSYAWEWGPLAAVSAAATWVIVRADLPALAVGAFYTSLVVMQGVLVRARWERDVLADELAELRARLERRRPC